MRAHARFVAAFVPALVLPLACVPPGNASSSDAGPASSQAAPTPTFTPSVNVMTSTFEDNFDRSSAPPAASSSSPPLSASASPEAGPAASASAPPANADRPPTQTLGPNWYATDPRAWHIENGQLCGERAHNHGVWMTKTLPVNARIEFDVTTENPDGDLKAEVWGDGHSFAKGTSYNDATSYLVIFGGWKNTIHAIARLDEHKKDRYEIKVDSKSDDPRERPVIPGQMYHFKIQRTDGKTVSWSVGDVQMGEFVDALPLAGQGHDHFAFNDWEVKVCFDNLKITPLP